jgi:hypothetical protein
MMMRPAGTCLPGCGCWLLIRSQDRGWALLLLAPRGDPHSEPAHTVSDIRRMDDPRRP